MKKINNKINQAVPGASSFAALGMTLLLGAMTFTACTSEEPLVSVANTPVTVSATIPGKVWAVASRTDNGSTVAPDGGSSSDGESSVAGQSFTDFVLHYTDFKGEPADYWPTDVMVDGSAVSFTTASSDNNLHLTWQQIDVTRPVHLTCKEAVYGYTIHTSVTPGRVGETLTFTDAMTPTVALLGINLALTHNLPSHPACDEFTATITARGEGSYAPLTHQGICPVEGEASENTINFLYGTINADGIYTVSAITFLPQQTMGNTLTIKYGTTATWTLDLSQVSVSDGESGQKANQLIVGQHLTLNLTASLIGLNTPSDIEIEAFTAAADGSYEDELGGSAKKSNP